MRPRTLSTGRRCGPSLVRGRRSAAILEYASDHDAGLLTMGTHGRCGVDRFVTGSVPNASSVSPRFRSHRPHDRTQSDQRGVRRILVPTDGSRQAEAAVDHALAERTGARIPAVSIVDIGALAVTPGYTHPSEVIERLEANGTRATTRLSDRRDEPGPE